MINVFLKIGSFFLKMKLIPFYLIVKYIIRIFFGSSIDPKMIYGKGVLFGYNGLGVVIHPNVKIGNNVVIAQNCTIGGKVGCKNVPVLGNNIYVGAGSVILGDIEISDGVTIGANSVVVKSILTPGVYAGVPVKEILK